VARRRGTSASAPVAPASLEPTVELTPDARARFDVVAPMLARRGPVDVERLTSYCQVWARWRIAESGLAKSGPLVKTSGGRLGPNPLGAVSKAAHQSVRQLEKELGLDRAPEDPAAAPGRLLTRRELADRLGGIHMQTVTKWEREGMPIAQHGGRGRPSFYSEHDVRAWRLERDQKSLAGTTVNANEERALKERAQARLAEQTYQMRNRELLPRSEVARIWGAEVAGIRALLLAWPTTIADKLARAATLEGVAGVEGVLNSEVRAVLNQLADPERQLPAAERAG
jgi:phage terminase small subunit/phage terminase Nu1 subunit (DNA packaging protein)